MSTISIDVESNKADLDALLVQYATAQEAVAAIAAQITSFSLSFTVSEVPVTAEVPAVAPEAELPPAE